MLIAWMGIWLAPLSVSAVALGIMIGFAWVYIAVLYGGVMSVDPGMGITEFAG